jgi:Leucine-rich repeat (LRR) protein
VRRETSGLPKWKSIFGFRARSGIVLDARGDEDVRKEEVARRNGGPGIKPGGVRKSRVRELDIQRELALESDFLRQFYEGVKGDNWYCNENWNNLLSQLRNIDGTPIEIDLIANMASSDITHYRDELFGIRAKWMDKKKFPKTLTHVVELKMPSNNLVGKIPDCLSELNYLKILFLPENKLTGLIPGFIGTTLLELRHIDLSYNNLSGNLPTFGVRFISHLKTMRLHDNSIGGSIHVLAGNMTELTALALHNNEIGGVLPESMTNMKKLEEVTMHNNRFTGPIPESFGRLMPRLRILSLSHNQFSSYVPVESFACCTNLLMCNLDNNLFDFDGEQGSSDQVLDYLKGRLPGNATVTL